MYFRKNTASGLIFLPFFLLLSLLINVGCGSKVVREDVVNTHNLHVLLRSTEDGGQAVAREFDHPAIIAPVRLSNIFSRLEIETKTLTKTERRLAIPWALQKPLGQALAQALEQATPDQEIVVYAIDKQYNIGIFVEKKLTTFVAFMREDRLEIHFANAGWIIPKGNSKLNDQLPEPHVNQKVMEFKLVTGDSMISTGAQSVSVDWRSDTFRRAGSTLIRHGGAVKREILMQEDGDVNEDDNSTPSAQPSSSSSESMSDLSPDQIDELIDLETERQQGAITEATYQMRYQKIMQGK